MLRRRVKQNARKSLKIFFLFFFAAVFLTLFIFFLQKIVPLFATGGEGVKKEVIVPVGMSVSTDDIKRELEQKNFSFDSVVESSRSASIIATMKDGVKVYFSKDKTAEYQISALKLITQRLKVENKDPELIDLRERRPIVKFK